MFITFEGPEGAGKTTLIQSLKQEFESKKISLLVTREPGEGAVGQAIRHILLDFDQIVPQAELFLFLADRAQHVKTVLQPALDRGEVVLCDRYTDSTLVYQGYGRGFDLAQLEQLNCLASFGLVPDITFLLDLDPVIGLSRQTKNDRLDLESLEFHTKVRDGFLLEAEKQPNRWVVLDATQSKEEVFHAALSRIKLHF
jgi:dTMP kinase